MKQRRWHWLLKQSKDRGWQYGVEVGVLYGQNIEYLLTHNPTLHLIGIDAWEPTDEYPDRAQMERYRIAAFAIKDLYPTRCVLFHGSSFEMHRQLPDLFFDFVFLDACHSYDAVRKDILNYWHKVKPGGWLCGHDIRRTGVQKALQLTVGMDKVHEVNIDGCWYVEKT